MILKHLTLTLFVATCGCAKVAPEASQSEVKSLIARAESCIHFSGEFNGEQSDRDKEVVAEMEKLKCADIDKALLTAKEKYKNNPEILKNLAEASANY